MVIFLFYMITTESKQPMLADVGLSLFTDVCGLDGHSQSNPLGRSYGVP